MTWGMVALGGTTLVGGLMGADAQEDAMNKSAKGLSAAQRRAEEINEARYQEARELLSPYLASSSAANRQLMVELGLGSQASEAEQQQHIADLDKLQTQLEGLQLEESQSKKAGKPKGIRGVLKSEKDKTYADAIADIQKKIAAKQGIIDKFSITPPQQEAPGSAYMRTPVYQGAIKAGTEAVNTGAADAGALYSGSRGIALRDVGQNVNQSMYANYMNLLQNAANPATATNLSSLGVGQAANIGQQNIASQQMQNAYTMQGAADRSALYSDVAGGLTSAFTAYMNRPKTPKVGISAPGAIDAGSTTGYSGYA